MAGTSTLTIIQLEKLYSSYHTTTTSLLGDAHLLTSEPRHYNQSGKVLLLQHVEAHGPRRQQQSYIDTIIAETSSTTRCTTGSRSTSHLPQSRWHAHLALIGTSRPPTHSKGSHQTSCSTNGMGLVTPQAYTSVHQGDTSLQVPHLTSTTSRRLSTTSTTHPVAHQHLLSLTVIRTGPQTSNRGSLPWAQSYQYLEYLLHSTAEQQPTIATSSAEAELYAIGLGVSDSLHVYQLLQELQQHLQ